MADQILSQKLVLNEERKTDIIIKTGHYGTSLQTATMPGSALAKQLIMKFV